jgi:hypothetical protein
MSSSFTASGGSIADGDWMPSRSVSSFSRIGFCVSGATTSSAFQS